MIGKRIAFAAALLSTPAFAVTVLKVDQQHQKRTSKKEEFQNSKKMNVEEGGAKGNAKGPEDDGRDVDERGVEDEVEVEEVVGAAAAGAGAAGGGGASASAAQASAQAGLVV